MSWNKTKILAKYRVEASRLPRYMEMFKFAWDKEAHHKFVDKYQPESGYQPDSMLDKTKEAIQRKIKRLMGVFEREDAIIWALRKFKAYLTKKPLSEEGAQAAKEWKNIDERLDTFNHILKEAKDNHIASINSYRFHPDADPEMVLRVLGKKMQEWQEAQSAQERILTEGNETLLKFADGWEWQVIPEGFCKKEGKAMRHCGNAPSVQEGDQLLSLREPVKLRKGGKGWKPHATFILHENGQLGEMKGFGNEKPKKDLHKYIIPLLKHDIVEGIDGGGYAPEMNFSMYDLPEETRSKIFEEKPSLMSILDHYKKFGLTDYVKDTIKSSDSGFKDKDQFITQNGEDYVKVAWFDNLADYANNYDKDLKEALKRLDDPGYYFDSFDSYYKWDAKTFFHALPHKDEKKVIDAILGKHQDKISAWAKQYGTDSVMDNVIEMIDNEKLEDVADAMETAGRWAEERATEEEFYKAVKSYLDDYRFNYDDVDLVLDDKTHVLDAEVSIAVKLESYLKELTAHPDSYTPDTFLQYLEPRSSIRDPYHGDHSKHLAECFLENF